MPRKYRKPNAYSKFLELRDSRSPEELIVFFRMWLSISRSMAVSMINNCIALSRLEEVEVY